MTTLLWIAVSLLAASHALSLLMGTLVVLVGKGYIALKLEGGNATFNRLWTARAAKLGLTAEQLLLIQKQVALKTLLRRLISYFAIGFAAWHAWPL